MDIKLKNRHKLGVGLIIAVIATAASSILALYPYMGKRVKSYGQESVQYYQNEAVSETGMQLMNGVYTLWMEQEQQRAGHLLTPSQVFLPELKTRIEEVRGRDSAAAVNSMEDTGEDGEDQAYETDDYEYGWQNSISYYTNIQQFMDSRGESWKNNYRKIADRLNYQLTDSQGTVLSENKRNDYDNIVYAEIAYDAAGIMTVAYLADEREDTLAQELAINLNYYTDHDPVRGSFDYEYMYNGLRFERPRNVVFKFWIPEDMMTNAGQRQEDVSISMFWYSRMASAVAGVFIILVSLAALILPCFPSLRIGQEKLFRAPCEIVTIIAAFGVAILADGYLPAAMVASTLNGLMATEIQVAGFTLDEAQSVAWMLNSLVWMMGFATVYWIITCYRSLFVLGLWRYIKERTLLGYFCRWVKRCWDRFCKSIRQVDFRNKSTKIIFKVVFANFLIVTVICSLWFFGVAALMVYSVALFFILNKYWNKLQQKYELLLNSFHQVATGNFDIHIDKSLGIFEPFRNELDTIQEGLKLAVDKEVQSQKMKTELITNVSHDLKTPLTAIITYVNLLKEDDLTDEERSSYVDVLEHKSMRLKVLIEDLFEVSKANSNNITLHLEPVDVVSLIKEVRLELSDQILQSGIDFRWELPEEKIVLTLDGQKTSRIFENLLVNITKYALPGTRAYIEIKEADDELYISLRNISAQELNSSGLELTDRFVRGDESRNTDGSGLGLAIAKSFTEVQGGRLIAETEADLFRVIIIWPIK